MFLVLVKQRFADFIDRWLTLQVVVVVVVADFLTGLPTLFFTVAELPLAGVEFVDLVQMVRIGNL